MDVEPSVTIRAQQMRALPDEIRRASIDAATNVFGFDRFDHRSKQVALRAAYRKPGMPEGK